MVSDKMNGLALLLSSGRIFSIGVSHPAEAETEAKNNSESATVRIYCARILCYLEEDSSTIK